MIKIKPPSSISTECKVRVLSPRDFWISANELEYKYSTEGALLYGTQAVLLPQRMTKGPLKLTLGALSCLASLDNVGRKYFDVCQVQVRLYQTNLGVD
jgi:hypothetical protein